jgi:hypothetical protein
MRSRKINDIFKDFSPSEFNMLSTQLKAEKKISSLLKIEDIIHLMRRFNLNIGRDKYLVQDELARNFSTFVDLIE